MKPFSCATDDSDKYDGVFVSVLVFLRSKPNLRHLSVIHLDLLGLIFPSQTNANLSGTSEM
jgi:hypothetical protein